MYTEFPTLTHKLLVMLQTVPDIGQMIDQTLFQLQDTFSLEGV